MADPSPLRTAREAWIDFAEETGGSEHADPLLLAAFYAGMGAALSIAYDHGFADLWAEIEQFAEGRLAELKGSERHDA